MRMIKGLCLYILLSSATICAAQKNQPPPLHGSLDQLVKTVKKNSLSPSDGVKNVVYYKINTTALKSLNQKSYKSLSWNLDTPQGEKRITLHEVSLFSSSYKLSSASGDMPKSRMNGKFYHGHTADGGLVALSVYDEEIKLLISDDDGNFELHPADVDNYVGYYDHDVDKRDKVLCHTPDIDINISPSRIRSSQKSFIGDCVDVYFECDYQSYIDNGSSIVNTENWVTSLFNEVKLIYANENIDANLSEIKVWDVTDPYASASTTNAMLSAFASHIQNDYNGRLAHLLTTRLSGGVAWVDVLCDGYHTSGNWGPYAVSAGLSTSVVQFPNYSWNVHVIAHEMGHNMGSPHTHACTWGPNGNEALDNCYTTEGSCSSGPPPTNGGTIMSYCHLANSGVNFNNGFGVEPGNLIRYYFNNSSCVTGCYEGSTPLGDSCHLAVDLFVSDTCLVNTFTNLGVTASGATPGFSCGNAGGVLDTWFKVEVQESGNLIIETKQVPGGLTDLIMQVYSGSCGTLTSVDCDDDGGAVRHSKVGLTGRTEGELLYVRIVDYQSNDSGSFGVCVYDTTSPPPLPPPPPIECDSMNIVSNLDYTVSDTMSAQINALSTGMLYPNLELRITAGDEIILNPGFEVQPGSTFSAEIIDCVSSLPEKF